MAVDREALKKQVAGLSQEDREALAEELGLARDASKADILKMLEGFDVRLKKLETPASPKSDGNPFFEMFNLFGKK